MMKNTPKNQEFEISFTALPGIRRDMRDMIRLWNRAIAVTGWQGSTLSLRVYGNVTLLQKMRSGAIQLRTMPALRNNLRQVINEYSKPRKNERKSIQL